MIKRVTIEVSPEIKDKIISFYAPIQRKNNGTYILFFGQNEDFTITVYSSKKDDAHKVFFIGKTALEEAKRWDKDAKENVPKQKGAPTEACWEVLTDQIGSDEVGTGDFFGPICVCAAFIREKDIPRLRKLGIDDSKRLSDEQIRKLGKILVKEFDYSQLSLNNEKYNELVSKGMNMNEIKAKLHNRVLYNVCMKHQKTRTVLMDQFVNPESYYSYISGEPKAVFGIKFKTKGESYFPSVAVGSIIARYSFLQHMDLLSKKYGVEIPFGANKKVTEFAKKFANKHGFDELDKLVKKNFANYQELTKLF